MSQFFITSPGTVVAQFMIWGIIIQQRDARKSFSLVDVENLVHELIAARMPGPLADQLIFLHAIFHDARTFVACIESSHCNTVSKEICDEICQKAV